jgi:hypothetical protein
MIGILVILLEVWIIGAGCATITIARHHATRKWMIALMYFIGFKLNKEYYDKACKRIWNEQRQLKLF